MTLTIVVSVLSCVGVLLLVLICPYVKIKGHKVAIYYLPALVGAIILMAVKNVDFSFVASSFTENTAVNPLKILVLFISMTILSIYLDELDFQISCHPGCQACRKNGIASLQSYILPLEQLPLSLQMTLSYLPFHPLFVILQMQRLILCLI